MLNMKSLMGALGIAAVLAFAAWAFVDMVHHDPQKSIFEASSQADTASKSEPSGNDFLRY